MKQLRDERGFTLIELIITLAIMALLIGGMASAFAITGNANAKKYANKIDAKMDILQSKSLGKSGYYYMYLFLQDGSVHSLICTRNDGTDEENRLGYMSLDELKAGTDQATKTGDGAVNVIKQASDIGGSAIEVGLTSSTSTKITTKLDASNMIKIGFDKSDGHFTCCKIADGKTNSFDNRRMIIKGRTTYAIDMVESTGKHICDYAK